MVQSSIIATYQGGDYKRCTLETPFDPELWQGGNKSQFFAIPNTSSMQYSQASDLNHRWCQVPVPNTVTPGPHLEAFKDGIINLK